MKTTNAISWHPLAGLPDELREQLATDATIELRRDGKRRSDRRWQALMAPGLAGLVAGIMAGLLIPRGPLPSPVQLAVLIGGAVCFAIWLAWFRGSSSRPLAGQGLLATPSTLVLIDHTSVAIVRAEHVDIDHGSILIARELIHRADEIFLDQVTRAQSTDITTRKADPWRAFANTAGGRPTPAPRTYPLGRAALHGLAAACVLELLMVTLGWRSSAAQAETWDHIDTAVDTQLAIIDRYQERAFVERLAKANSTEAMHLLLAQAYQLEADNDLRRRVVSRYRVKLADELADADDPRALERRLTVAQQQELPDEFTSMIRGRLGAAVVASAEHERDANVIASHIARLARTGTDDAPRDKLLAQLAALADETVAAAGLDDGAQLYAAIADHVPSAHPMREKLITRLRQLVRTELPGITDTHVLYLRFARVRRLVPDEQVTTMINARFETLVRAQVTSISDTELLLNYYELRLNDRFDAFLTRRFETVALEEIRRAPSADSIDHFRKEAEVLGLSAEFKQTLENRLTALSSP